MKSIKCKKCNQIKKHEAFGLCNKCYLKKYQLKNKKSLIIKRKKYYQQNREKLLQQKKEYHKKYKLKINAKNRIYRKRNKERLNQYRSEYYYNKIDGEILIKNSHGKPYLTYKGGKAIHRVIAEKILGRQLKSNEVVHHIDKNTLNNEHANLIICNRDYHSRLHRMEYLKENGYATK